LHDYAGKLNLEKPEYNIVQLEGQHPLLFVSSVRFNGTHYTGTTAKNKKTAEQLAAYHAIVTMLGTVFFTNSALLNHFSFFSPLLVND